MHLFSAAQPYDQEFLKNDCHVPAIKDWTLCLPHYIVGPCGRGTIL